MVDVGLPARLKLTEVGPPLRPFLEEKLGSGEYTERMTAIQLLASIGEPQERVKHLLARELERAAGQKQEVGVLKCATMLSDFEPVLAHVSSAALDAPHQGTRQLAVSYLMVLRSDPDAPPELAERLAELMDTGDLKVRIEIAMNLINDDASKIHRVLLEGLNSDDEDTAIVAANHVARLRESGRITPETWTPEEIKQALDAHRNWLERQLEQPEETAGEDGVAEGE